MSDIDSQEMLAVAIAAYEINRNQYLKDTTYDYNLDGSISSTKWANKEILKSHFGIDHYSVDANRPPKVIVNDLHRQRAIDIKRFTSKAIFGLIAKNKDDNMPYDQLVYLTVNKDKVTMYDAGVMASVPYYYDNHIKKKALIERLDAMDSQWVGTIGNKVVLKNMEIIKKRYSINYDTSIVHGICDNNLFMFFLNEKDNTIVEGSTIAISAKVKNHVLENDKYKMTRLYYVRETKQ